ncbi:MAG TPA: SDR family oxidoreductase [Clostridia bacterium]|jgi:short-subunit dehydrogenase|nr:MAG: putative oxidoreductase [Firmicutes bacterium ADurb.Bin146]HOD93998.1 SDR family oxidoreductase [Clostridia bacterium]HQM39302.1 SDR family oxidoreductase [Clostridia bacterium]
MDTKTAVITGASSGIGLATALKLISKGYLVYNLSRRDFINEKIRHISCDVSLSESVNKALRQVYDECGRIDVLITSAGIGVAGAVEFISLDDAKKQIDVNLFGTINTVKAVIPYMREKKAGNIICISSVAAAIPIPFQTYYSVSKAAINAFVSALSHEVRPFNISISSVMPGDIKTGFTASRKTDLTGDDIYSGRIKKSISIMENDEINGMSADIAANFIAKLVDKKKLKPLYTVGMKYRLFVLLSKLLPQKAVSAIVSSLYAK